METQPEVVPVTHLEAQERARIDIQVATARRYGRDVAKFLAEAKSMIGLDLDTAEACSYQLKRKNQDGGIKIIEGPSIRLLEIAASCWEHLSWVSRTVGETERTVTVQAVAEDHYRNNHCGVEVIRRISTKDGRRFSDDMVVVTTMAAQAIARRNALGGIIPRAYVEQLRQYALQVAKGSIKTLPERRQRALSYFTTVIGVDLAKVLIYLERKTVEDITVDDIEKLTQLKTALKDGDATVEEVFAAAAPPAAVHPVDDGRSTPAEIAAAKAMVADIVKVGEILTGVGDRGEPPPTQPRQEAQTASPSAPMAASTPAPAGPVGTIHEEVLDWLIAEGISEVEFGLWAEQTGNVPNATAKTSINEYDGRMLRRVLRVKADIAAMIKAAREPRKPDQPGLML